ncbi:MAG: hypothetical protein IKD53_01880 [Clostridia bacterium]|nr:hypothetical protein [Clostridia bacterium]
MDRKRNTRLPWAIALLIVVFVCIVAYLGARLISGASRKSAYEYKTIEIASNLGLEVVEDGFVYYDGSSIGSVTTDAKVKWSYLIGKNADFDATDYGVAAWSEDSLTLIDSDTGTTTFSGNMDASVLSARMGERYTAVLLGPEHDSTIVLMEKGGRKVNSITLTHQTVIDYGFFSKGSLMWVMSLDSSGTVPSCTVNTYRPGKERVGMIHDNEQLMYGVVFQSSYFCCAGDTYLKVYDYTGSEDKSRRRLVYGWYMAALDGSVDNPIMAFVPNDQYDAKEGMRDVRMIRANLDQQVRMPYGAQSLVVRNNRVFGFSTEGYVMIAEQGKAEVSAYRLPLQFDKVYGVTRDSCAVLGNGNTIYLLSLA